MTTRGAIAAIWLTLVCVVGVQSHAGDRVALLIGNRPADAVADPSIDKFATDLVESGFSLTRKSNLDAKQIETAIREFLQSAPTAGTAVVSFSGHGLSAVGGKEKQRWIALQGIRPVRDQREAERASHKLDRLAQLIRQDSGAAAHHFVFHFLADNPALDDAVVPSESDLAQLAPVEATQFHLRADKAIAKIKAGLIDRPFTYCQQPQPRAGKVAGEHWVNGIGMVWVWCPAGRFTMGLAARHGVPSEQDAAPVEAEMTRGFWIAKYELTRREYRAIRGKDPNRGAVSEHRNAPVTNFGNGAAEIAKKLTQIEQRAGRLPSGWTYAVPTEAEWEYACRAGSSTRFCFGDDEADLHQFANFADRSLRDQDPAYHYASYQSDDGIGATLATVGTYRPNRWGIHDMHGNVSEWCQDHYLPKLTGGKDPFPSEQSQQGEQVVRGGAWCSRPQYCQSGFRSSTSLSNNAESLAFLGVRFVLRKVEPTTSPSVRGKVD